MARRPLAKIREANDAARAALHAVSSTQPAGDHLGDLAWWDPTPAWKASVPSVVATYRAHGLDPDACLPAAPDWPVAFGRAIYRVNMRLAERDYKLIDAAPGPGKERRVAIVKIERNGRVSSEDVGTVTCPKTGAAAFVERADPAGIADEILKLAASLVDVYTVDDIRNGIVDTFDRWSAMPCRQAPPHMVYWVPPAAGAVVRQLADAVEAIGWGRIELFAGYASDKRSARACVNAVNQGLEAKLNEFAEKCEKYTGGDPDKLRANSLEAKLTEAAQLRQQGALYREILGAAVTSIEGRIAHVEDALRVSLGLVARAS